MTIQDYLAKTTVSGERVLDDWRWLIGPELQLWYVTKAGNALLRMPIDGSIHFLDTAAGSVEFLASDVAAFKAAVVQKENLQRWLSPAIVEGQAAVGMTPGENECLSFKRPPILGGRLAPDNFEVSNVEVHFSVAGQIHQQVKNLPPGTKIRSVKIG
jgi:hypothetical protein